MKITAKKQVGTTNTDRRCQSALYNQEEMVPTFEHVKSYPQTYPQTYPQAKWLKSLAKSLS